MNPVLHTPALQRNWRGNIVIQRPEIYPQGYWIWAPPDLDGTVAQMYGPWRCKAAERTEDDRRFWFVDNANHRPAVICTTDDFGDLVWCDPSQVFA